MQSLTAEDYELDKYQEDYMNAHNLRFRVSPAVQAIADRMRQSPKVASTPQLSGLEQAVLAEPRRGR